MLYSYLCIKARINTQTSQNQSFVYSRRNNIIYSYFLKN